MRVIPGMFYTRFHDETVEQAIDTHSMGYKSIQEAVEDSNAIEYPNVAFVVLNDKLEVVWTGVTKALPDDRLECETPKVKE